MGINMEVKTCNKCKIIKSIADFNRDSSNSSGREYSCRECRSFARKLNYNKNHVQSKEKSRLKSLEFRKTRKDYLRDYDLKRYYGISLKDYETLLSSQNNTCKICKTAEPGGKHKIFNVDHCHITGKVRGLLCTGCNMALGGFKDNIETLKIAIDYLQKEGNI